MRRTTLFIALTVVSLISLVSTVIIGYFALTATSANSSNWMDQMWGGMGGMMGGYRETSAPVQNSFVAYFGVALVAFIVLAVVGFGGLVYFVAFPEIKNSNEQGLTITETNADLNTPYTSVLKTLNNDERKVLQVLSSHEGKYLQKYIRKEANLSRLKVHRILSRLSERGVVSLEKTGNTNSVLLADWLR